MNLIESNISNILADIKRLMVIVDNNYMTIKNKIGNVIVVCVCL